MKNPERSEPVTTLPDPRELEEHIRRRAYELYEARGREDGHELDDWFQARRELTNTKRKVTAA